MNDYKLFLVDDDGSYSQLELETVDFSTIFSINDITDITKRKDTISKNISIIGTKNNNRVLGNLANLNRVVNNDSNLNYNYKANNQTNCLIYENNILLLKGQLQIVSATKNSNDEFFYDCIVTGDVFRFFNKLKDTDLKSLNFGIETHTYDLTTIKNSWTATNLQYIYPSIDYGAYPSYNTNFDFRNFRCGLYLKTYFDAIFKTFNYTYTSTFATTSIFKKCYIPYAEKSFNRVIDTAFFTKNELYIGHTLTADSLRPSYRFSKPIPFFYTTGNTFIDVLNTSTDGLGVTFQTFKFKRNIKCDGKLTMDLASTTTVSGSRYVVGIFPVISSVIDFWNPLALQEFDGNTLSTPITLNLPVKEYVKGYEFAIATSPITPDAIIEFGASNIQLQLGTANKSYLENELNDTLTIKDCLPNNIKAYDLLKDLLKVFNLMITLNPEKPNDFIIEDFASFYKNTINPKATALNWSNKLENAELSTGFNLVIPKQYKFTFKEDTSNYWLDDYKKKYNEGYGDALYINTDGYSDESKVEVSFSAIPIVSNSVDGKSLPNVWTGDPTKKESYKSNLGLLFNNGIAPSNLYNIGLYTTSGTTATYLTGNTTYNLSSHILKDGNGKDIFNLQFGVPKEVNFPTTKDIFSLPNLYTTFYKEQIDELIDPNFSTLECEMWLNENDISNLNFQTPIFLSTEKIGDAYFKLIEVNYKSSLELSKVKLQKIIF